MTFRPFVLSILIAFATSSSAISEQGSAQGWRIWEEPPMRFFGCTDPKTCGERSLVSYKLFPLQNDVIEQYLLYEAGRQSRELKAGTVSSFQVIRQNVPVKKNDVLYVSQYRLTKKGQTTSEVMTTVLMKGAGAYIGFISTAQTADRSLKNLAHWSDIVLTVMARQPPAAMQP